MSVSHDNETIHRRLTLSNLIIINNSSVNENGCQVNKKIPSGTAQECIVGVPALHIPLGYAVFEKKSGKKLAEGVHELKAAGEFLNVFLGANITSVDDVVLSLNRAFSGCIRVAHDWSDADLSTLAASEDDAFAKFEAYQSLSKRCVFSKYESLKGEAKEGRNALEKNVDEIFQITILIL